MSDNEVYYITVGPDGPRADGPYLGDSVALRARSGMARTWRMILHRQRYWITPAANPPLRETADPEEG